MHDNNRQKRAGKRKISYALRSKTTSNDSLQCENICKLQLLRQLGPRTIFGLRASMELPLLSQFLFFSFFFVNAFSHYTFLFGKAFSFRVNEKKKVWTLRDLNPWPLRCKRSALPLS